MRAATAKLENFVLSVGPIAEIGYQRTYSASSLILLFFIFSGMGWIWEVILHIIEDGMIINRGVLAGPWLPIYGAGGNPDSAPPEKMAQAAFSSVRHDYVIMRNN